MKFFIFLFLAFSFFNVNTFAAQNLIAPQSEAYSDPYSELESLFNKGTLPSTKDYIGMFTGRSFDVSSKTTAINTLYIGQMLIVGEDNGPLFPVKEEYHATAAFSHYGPANHYDVLTEKLRTEIQEFLSSSPLHSTSTENGALNIKASDTVVFLCKSYQSYLICKYSDDSGGLAYSYFFKKID